MQVDEANVPGSPDAPLYEAINRILDQVQVEKAVHFCFGNYGGKRSKRKEALLDFLNGLHADHGDEVAHRPDDDLEVLKDIDTRIKLGIGVIDIKVSVESPEVAKPDPKGIESGPDRVAWVHRIADSDIKRR